MAMGKSDDEKSGFPWLSVILGFFVLVAILVAIALPSMSQFNCRAAQTYAKEGLKSIHTLQSDLHRETGRYGTMQEIGWGPKMGQDRYDFVILEKSKNAFRAQATTAKRHAYPKGDVWRVNESGEIQNTVNGCK
jgi:type IV pilus assembly protein PilA